jgi:hypothetical protein
VSQVPTPSPAARSGRADAEGSPRELERDVVTVGRLGLRVRPIRPGDGPRPVTFDERLSWDRLAFVAAVEDVT